MVVRSMRCRSLLFALWLLAVPCTALGGLPQGTFTLDAIMKDATGPWLVQFVFSVSESGAVTGAKITYPNDPCQVCVSSTQLSGNSVIFQEAVVKGEEVCAPSRYILTYDPVAKDWGGRPWSDVRCTLEGKEYVGKFRNQAFAAGGITGFYAKKGVSSWEELAQKRDWDALILFYDKVKSNHRRDALNILKELGREDPTGKRAWELTRRCVFDGEWDYLQSVLTPEAGYEFLVERVHDAPDQYVGWALRLALASALRDGPEGYTRFLTDNHLLIYRRSELVTEYALKRDDRAELEFLAGQQKLSYQAQKIILDALYSKYAAEGENGYRHFAQKYPKSSQARQAGKEITKLNADKVLASNSPAYVRGMVVEDPDVLGIDGVRDKVVAVLRAGASSGDVDAFIRRIDDSSLCLQLRTVRDELENKERAAQIELAIRNKDIPALRKLVASRSVGDSIRNRAEAILFESVRSGNTVQGYEEFLSYAGGAGVREEAISCIYALTPAAPDDQVAFAVKYPSHEQSAAIWESMYAEAVETGLFSSADPEKVEAFIKLGPPTEYVQKCLDLLGVEVLDGDRESQMAFITKYPGSPFCERIRKKIAEQCKDGDMQDMTWFLAVFEGTPEAEDVGAVLAHTVYDKVVSRKDTVDGYNSFCALFAGVAPKALLEKAYNRAMRLHKKWLEGQIDAAQGVFTSELAENENYEKIARKLFHAASKCEDSGDILGARQIYQLLDGSDVLSQTQTSYDNLRDKKMRRFLDGKFDALIEAQDRGARMLVKELQLVSSTVERSKLTRENFKQFNEDRMWAGRSFKKTFGDY